MTFFYNPLNAFITFFYELLNAFITFFYKPHHSIICDESDIQTAAFIAKILVALNDLADVLPADSFSLDEEIVHDLQIKEYNEWLSIAEDARLAKSIGDALATEAYLDAFITAEEAAKEDRIAAELLSRGEALPVPKSCQTRLEDPAFVMDPVYIASYVYIIVSSSPLNVAFFSPEMDADQAWVDNVTVGNGLLDGALDNEWLRGESVGSGVHLMQNLVI